MAKAMKYIINVLTGALFIWTKELSKQPNMAACDKDGKLNPGAEPVAAAAAPTTAFQKPAEQPGGEDTGDGEGGGGEDTGDGGGPLTLDEYKSLLAEVSGDELKAKATGLDVKFNPLIGDDKLRTRVLEAVAERLKDVGDE